jgi:hypothetical protein
VIEGPAIVEQTDTTVLIPPGAGATVDRYLNIVIDVARERPDEPSVAAAEPVAEGV